MTVISIGQFNGENRAITPVLLADGLGVQSTNQKPGRGDFRPWNMPMNVATIPPSRKTIYRMGRDVVSDANYWLSWPTAVSVVRGFNESDSGERTYYTGDGAPKWTDAVKALASAPYPTSYRELGIPAPATACVATTTSVSPTDPDGGKHVYTFALSEVGLLKVGDTLRVAVSGQVEVYVVLIAGVGGIVTKESLAVQLNGVAGLASRVLTPAESTTVGVRVVSTTQDIGFTIERRVTISGSYFDSDVTYQNLYNTIQRSDNVTPATFVIAPTGGLLHNLYRRLPQVGEQWRIYIDAFAPVLVTFTAGVGGIVTNDSCIADLNAKLVGAIAEPNVLTLFLSGGVKIATTSQSEVSKISIDLIDRVFNTLCKSTELVISEQTKETRAYTYTYVSDTGEEGAPAPVSVFLTCYPSDTANITLLAAPPSGNYGINRIRIYRTQSGDSGATDFYFLREIVSTLNNTTDDLRTLGETLTTTTWIMPPANLKMLTELWNGMMSGISGRSVRFCEPYVPYAWPIAYEILPAHSTPVALATFGQTLVILTNGNPILATGSSPDSMDEQPMEFLQACVAPLSVVSMGHGVAWASPDGLAYVGQGGARLLTAGVMTKDDWKALKPETIQGCMYDGRYFGFYEPTVGVRKGFVLDSTNPSGMYFLDTGAEAVYVDDLQDALYLVNGVNVQKWDAGLTPMTATYRSKVFHLPKPTGFFGCAEMAADAYPVTLKVDAVNMKAADVTKIVSLIPSFTAPNTTTVRYTATFTERSPIRMPSGFMSEDYQIEVATSSAVQAIVLANSMQELAST